MTALAPVVLFLFNRPQHARRTLHALARNDVARQTDLIIYCDGAREDRDENLVKEVRSIAKGTEGFRSLEVVNHKTNLGLAQSIVQGVTDVIGQRGKVIVMEDDLLTARSFLTYMNDALERFANEARVWHVAGWNHQIRTENLPPFFFWSVMHCWGWATWSDRWSHYRKEPQRLLRDWNAERIHAFNLDSTNDFFAQVRSNHAGEINTWAIFWYASIFENGGLCLSPTQSFVSNIGLDRSGTHGEDGGDRTIDPEHAYRGIPELEIKPNAEVIARVQEHLRARRSIAGRVSRRIRRLVNQLGRLS